MTDTFKVLGQSRPSASVLTDLYTVPNATQTTVSSLVICNQSAATTFRLSVAIVGTNDSLSQYLAFDIPLDPNQLITLTLGITLGTTDKIRCQSASGLVSFNAFGVEIS